MTTGPKISRAFRPYILTHLQGLNGWREYCAQRGWHYAKRLPKAEILAACAVFNVDLYAVRNAFTASVLTNASVGALADQDREEMDDARDSDGDDGDAEPPKNAEPQEPLKEAAEPPQSFEGRDAKELMAEILAPVSVHLTPHLQSRLPELFAPVISAAIQGPRTVRVGISANVAGAATVAKRVKIAPTFGINRAKASSDFQDAFDKVELTACNYEASPAIDANYVWTDTLAATLAIGDSAGMNVWLAGPAGVGKTEGVTQYAARLSRPFVRIAINRTTEPADLIGQYLPTKDGGVEWRDGTLTRVFRTPYCVCLIDEPTLLRPGSLAVFQTALDTRELHLPNGEIVQACEGLFVVAADNTAGVGDETERYADTSPMNAAFLDRFALRLNVPFLSLDDETDMLTRRIGLARDACILMVDYANATRADAESGKLTMGVTSRRLLSWARAVRMGMTSQRAFQMSVMTGADPMDRETLQMLQEAKLGATGHARIDALAHGRATPTLSKPRPAKSGDVADMFPDDLES